MTTSVDDDEVRDLIRRRSRPDPELLREQRLKAFFASEQKKQRLLSASHMLARMQEQPLATLSATEGELETLLSSTLAELSPAEATRARHGKYPIFQHAHELSVYDCMSPLCNKIPFELETPLDTEKILGSHAIYYHDETINWIFDDFDFELKDTRKPNARGSLVIRRTSTENSDPGDSELEGCVYYFYEKEGETNANEEDEIWDSEEDTEAVDGFDEGEIGGEDDGADDGSEEDDEDERENIDGFEEVEDGEIGGEDDWADEESEEDYQDEREEDEESCETEEAILKAWLRGHGDEDVAPVGGEEENNNVSEAPTHVSDFMKRWSFFHFREGGFVPDSNHERASWYDSGSEQNFRLTRHPGGGGGARSVSVFRVNESMAFARGNLLHFVSLDKADNYGNTFGRNYHHDRDFIPMERDSTHQRRVLQSMQAYRRWSWISKLCPRDMAMPDDVARLITEFCCASPPPFLFVSKGDILLLARYEERVYDLDFPEKNYEDIIREHVILARPEVY